MEIDSRINTDLKSTSKVYRIGIERILEKNERMIAHLKKKSERLIDNINDSQSIDIQAGFLPDDDNDILKELHEVEEEFIKNLEELGNTMVGTTESVEGVISSSGFMRLTKTEATIKTFPE